VHWFASIDDAQQKSMRFGGTTMSIVLTELSRVSALGNSLQVCSKRPQSRPPSGPKKGGPSKSGRTHITRVADLGTGLTST